MALAIGSLRRRLAPWCGLLIICLGLWIFSFFRLLDFTFPESDRGSGSDVPKNVYSKRAVILHPSSVLKADNNITMKEHFSFEKLHKVNSVPKSINFQEIFDYKLYPKLGTYSPHWDLLRLGPFKFIKGSKNPCWFNNEHFVVCLPYFYVIGAPKCGTTDLFSKISAHPEFISPIVKEPEWISYDRFEYLTSDLSIYASNFAPIAYNIQQGYKDGEYKGKQFITGDFSPTTMWQNDNWPWLPGNANAREPNITNADYVKHLNPNVKIIAILRNPTDSNSDRLYQDKCISSTRPLAFLHGIIAIQEFGKVCINDCNAENEANQNLGKVTDRLIGVGECCPGSTFGNCSDPRLITMCTFNRHEEIISHEHPAEVWNKLFSDYLHFRNQYATASLEDFHQWASHAVEVFNDCLQRKNSARECAYNEEVASRTGLHLRIGLYAIYLRDWLKVIPTQNMLVLRLEDHEKKPQKTMKAIFDLLSLKTDKKIISQISKQMKANGKEEMRSHRSSLGPMLPKTRKILDNFYKRFNIDLAQLLNDNKFNY